MPANPSPNSSRATCPPRNSRTTNTVTRLVTATHNHARLSPWRQLVSSRWATSCASTQARASSTGGSNTCVVAFSDWLTVPTLIGTPNTSSITWPVMRLDKRYAPCTGPPWRAHGDHRCHWERPQARALAWSRHKRGKPADATDTPSRPAGSGESPSLGDETAWDRHRIKG